MKTHSVMITGVNKDGVYISGYENKYFQADCGRIISNDRSSQFPTCKECRR